MWQPLPVISPFIYVLGVKNLGDKIAMKECEIASFNFYDTGTLKGFCFDY